MTVGMPPEFIKATVTLLRTTWDPHRRSFKVKEVEELTGKLYHIADSAPWLKYLLGSIYASLAAALPMNNSHLICTKRTICLVLPSHNGDTQCAYHTGATARSIHGCIFLHHISGDLLRDLRLIKQTLLSTPTPKSCPITQLIPRVPCDVACSDSSLTAVRGYCPVTMFWWYLEWTATVQARTLRHIHTRCNPTLISINSLEYAVQLITMMGCHLHGLETAATRHDPIPYTSSSATTPRENRGSPEAAPPAPPAANSLGSRPLSSSTKARAIASATSTQKRMSLPTASHTYHLKMPFLMTSLFSLRRPLT
jgi:hypothetical protein